MAKKKQAARATSVPAEVLPAVPAGVPDEEIQILQTDGGILGAFLGNWRQFFTRAREIEDTAQARLKEAKAFKVPTTEAQSKKLQTWTASNTREKGLAVEHWSLKASFNRLHRLIVAGEKRAVDAHEEARKVVVRLQEQYITNERRAREERDRQAREADERRQREENERQANALEERALAAEAEMAGLSPRERTFVDTVAADPDATVAAAQAAGYRHPIEAAPKLMKQRKIQEAIAAAQRVQATRAQATATRDKPVASTAAPEAAPKTPKIRYTVSADVFDDAAFVAAVVEGKYGVPLNLLTVNQQAATLWVRTIPEAMVNLVPGIRVRKTPS